MNDRMSGHLSEEALMRWQMGDATAAERAHVAMCTECQAQAKPLQDALSWFGAAARQWGEEKGAAAQQWRESKAAAARGWRSMAAAWALVSVALLLMFGIGLPRWKAHRAAIEAQAQQQQEQRLRQELARDNALLDEIDQDVSQVVPEAMQSLSWNTANNGAVSSTDGAASRQ